MPKSMLLLLRYHTIVHYSLKQYDSDKQSLEKKIDIVDKKNPNTKILVQKITAMQTF